MKIIVSLDGGGCLGYHAVSLLSEIEKRSGLKISDFADIISGTSIGSVCGLLLCNGWSADKSLTLFTKYAPKIFKKELFRFGLFGPKYNSKNIEDVLLDVFGDSKLSDCKTKFICPSYDLVRAKTVFFKSYDDSSSNFMRDAARSSSSAQTYFKHFILNNKVLIDGGNSQNNPSMAAYVDALGMWKDEDVYVISLGCGQKNEDDLEAIKHANCGLIRNGIITIETLFNGSEEDVDYKMDKLIGNKYIRLNPILKYNVELDGTSKLDMQKWQINSESSIQQFSLQLDFIVNLIKSKVNDNKLPIKN